MLRMLTAWALLSTAYEPSAEEFGFCMLELQEIGYSLELMDRKTETLFSSWQITDQLETLRWAFKNLNDAPSAWELQFVDRPNHVVKMMLQLSHESVSNYLVIKSLYPYREDYRVYWEEAKKLHEVWQALDRVKSPSSSLSTRRDGLKFIRNSIGSEAFYQGRMPNPGPYWRMITVRR